MIGLVDEEAGIIRDDKCLRAFQVTSESMNGTDAFFVLVLIL